MHLAAAHGGVTLWRQNGDGWAAGEAVPGLSGAGQVWLWPGAAGQIDLFWIKTAQLVHSRRAAGVWGAATALSPVEATPVLGLRLAQTPDGAIHTLWGEAQIHDSLVRYRRLATGGAWGEAQTLAAGPIDGLGLAADDAGRVHAAWLLSSTADPALHYRRLSGETWQPVETLWRGVVEMIGYDVAFLQAFDASPDGVAQALLWFSDDYVYARREPGGRLITEHLAGNELNGPTMVLDAAGNPHVAIVDSFGGNPALNVGYIARPESGDWSAPAQASNDPGYGFNGLPVIDPLGRVHILWHIPDGGYDESYLWPDLMYTGPRPAAAGGESSLSRTVTVPADMPQPVLSFMHAGRGMVTLDLTGGRDQASSPSGTLARPPVRSETILLPPAPAGYRHEWVDLSAYAGQTVQLTLRASWAAGEPVAWARFDDVTLGAAHTDVGVTADGGQRLANNLAHHTVFVSNDSALPAAGVSLVYTLPPQLAFVSADPAPASLSPLRWELGELAAGETRVVRLTTRAATGALPPSVNSAAAVATTSEELELLNNTAAATTTLRREGRVVLPAIMRP
jgi:hypothetical protein